MTRQHLIFFFLKPCQKIYIKKEIKFKKKNLKSNLIKKNYYLSLLIFIRLLQLVLHVLPNQTQQRRTQTQYPIT